MAEVSFGTLQGKLMACEKYNPVDSAILTEMVFNNFDEEVRRLVFNWVEGKDVASETIEEVTVTDIIDSLECTTFQALCILNAVKNRPDCFDSAVFSLNIDEIRETGEA